MFTCGEDKAVKCWDLEHNKVIRSYHGHLSGVYCIKLHPKLDLLFTGARDSTIRVWDMRTKAQVHLLGGHQGTVESLLTSEDEPQIISGSGDKMIKFWDIRTGSCHKTLTYHKKGVRALVQHHDDYSIASGAADKLRFWKLPDGEHLRTIGSHNSIVNSLALNKDNVLVSAADNGTMQFHDWDSGHTFQREQTIE